MSNNDKDKKSQKPSKQPPNFQPENESQEKRLLRFLENLFGNKLPSEKKWRLVRRFLVWPNKELQQLEEKKPKLNENQKKDILNNINEVDRALDKENPAKENNALVKAETGLKQAIAACMPELKAAIPDTKTLQTAISESRILRQNPPAQPTSRREEKPSLINPSIPKFTSPLSPTPPEPTPLSPTSTTTPKSTPPRKPWDTSIPKKPEPPGGKAS
jgi:hypothetical protein